MENWSATRWITTGLASLVGLLLVWVLMASAVWGFGVATAGIYGRGEARKEIQSAALRIGAYNHFFDVCASIQTSEAQLDALFNERAAYPAASKDYARTQTNITGVLAQRQRSIFQYNADAQKDYTIGQFKSSKLPYQLDSSTYPEGGKTICVLN